MPEFPEISAELELAVAQSVESTLQSHLPQLQEEITRKVLSALAPALQAAAEATRHSAETIATPVSPAAKSHSTDLLNAAVQSIYDGLSQAEILAALLNGLSQFTSRAALCVVRGTSVSVWKSRGFSDEAALKAFSAETNQGLIARAVQARTPVSAAATEFDLNFISTHGNPNDGNASVLPLIVREKVPALVYADAGVSPGGSCDASALEVLVKTASTWLELIALRKGAPAEVAPPAQEVAAPAPAPVATAPVAVPAMAAAAAAPAPQAMPTPPAPEPSAPSIPPATTAAAVPQVAAPSVDTSTDGMSPEDQEVHKRAKRFAKLLVDEIKLYNQAKVTEGKQNKNLFSLLHEDIEKSRATYDKRYGATPAGNARYFDSELLRILADNDASLFGAGFPQ